MKIVLKKVVLFILQEQLRLAFEQSEKEVENLRQRTREGIKTARLARKQIGRIEGRKYTSKKKLRLKKSF